MLDIKAMNPEKYALALLSALFSDEELATSCYAETSRSKKPALPQEKIQILEGIIYYILMTQLIDSTCTCCFKNTGSLCKCDLSRENVAYAIFLEMHFIMHSCRAIFALFIATYRVKIGQSVAKLLPI